MKRAAFSCEPLGVSILGQSPFAPAAAVKGKSLPHRLDLYRLAVQHPQAEAAFLAQLAAHYRRGSGLPAATRLKEDFCGSAGIAAAWVGHGEDRRAVGVDLDAVTLRWGWRRARATLGARADDLHLVQGDVTAVARTLPRVDVVAALNFSAFFHHSREAMRAYLRASRASLAPQGVFVMDAYGGPGAMRIGKQTRRVEGEPANGVQPFDYIWEQRAYDTVTARVDCRMHFRFDSGRPIANAFRYDWRLWTLPELIELLQEAGFDRSEVWCDRYDSSDGRSDGKYRPARRLSAREDWIAYVIGVR